MYGVKVLLFATLVCILLSVRPTYQDGIQSMLSLVLEKGYPVEYYEVVTEDGYILSTFRIPHGRNSTKVGKPVILQHGILCSSAVWVFGTPEESLGFLLVDHGYDVWMPNVRGSTYSEKHISLDANKDKQKYWDFTFHEMGYYDLPAVIDFVLNKTGETKLHYVGHSQGTTQFFVMASARPEYNAKVRHMSALAPISFMENSRGGVKLLGYIATGLKAVANLFGWYAVLENSYLMNLFESTACKIAATTPSICTDFLFLLAGYDSEELNADLIPLITTYTPAGASVKQLIHYSQLIKNGGKFTYYDYQDDNYKYYNQETPWEYNLTKITTPVMLHYSSNDWVSGIPDVEKLSSKLPNNSQKLVEFEKFNHLDFMWATHAYELVFKDLIDSMSQY